ncbi:MAG: hypothetical protein PHC61_04760 [Chitinivibrionales bacterium]|nr:hypothetical protein [Chitinivibrionales bacterium]
MKLDASVPVTVEASKVGGSQVFLDPRESFPGCDGLKTGYFKQAGYSILATAGRNNARVITVVLGAAKGPDYRHPGGGRDAKAAELMIKGFAALAAQPSTQLKTK